MPVDRWSTAQVLALAPDPGAAKGARSVSGAAKWEATGLADEVLWGLCKGSGKHPYQVCVDLSGPAYRCSCPSRKFPCKHALGLLLSWAESGAVDAAAPDWVIQWHADRVARSARAAAPRATTGPADPAAAAKRAEQRSARITSGMEELRRWLDDQVQQGLAAAAEAGHQPYEAMAARLVDAQAPGMAGAVRRLGRLPGVGPHWADRLLGELGLVRLLVSAHRRLDELPPELAATVRTRIGFPTSSEEVLATPPVRDTWQVLGQVDSVDDRVTSRRSWLRGARTGRFALLLAFAAPGQAVAADVAGGTEFDADLCFYPGALPLRALIATRHGAPTPTGVPAGATGVRAALAQYTAALAADPWRESVPVLLAGVTPTGDGHVVDAAGDALALAPGHHEPWWLLAACGAQPAEIAGELGPAGLRPLAAWPDGRYRPAGAGVPAGRIQRAAALPTQLLSTALVGTARRPFGAEATVPLNGRSLVVGGDGTAGALLEAAAVAVTYRRAAATPSAGHHPVAVAPPEIAPQVPPATVTRLHLLLAEEGASAQSELLTEWLQLADGRAAVVPPETLPMLLDAGRQNTALRPLLARLAGERGRWLAAQRPEWAYLLEEALPATAPVPADRIAGEGWETGTTGERLAHLVRLRRRDPAAGRELLATTFPSESAQDRARFVAALATGLSLADDEFLERALDDRRKEVRQAAAGLLRRLPGSGLGRRMGERASECVHLDGSAAGGPRLVVTAPARCDPGLQRDGVEPQPPPGVGLGAWLLEEIVAATPLETWTTAFERSPAQLLALPVTDDRAEVLLRGWIRAAAHQRSTEWASALTEALDWSGKVRRHHLHAALPWQLAELLPSDRLTRLVAHVMLVDPSSAPGLLRHCPGPWPDELATVVTEMIGRQAGDARSAWFIAELCRLAGTAMPPRCATRVSDLADSLERAEANAVQVHAVRQLAAVLAFRSEMHKEFA